MSEIQATPLTCAARVAAAGLLDVREKFMQDIENIPLLLKKGLLKEDPSRGFLGLTEDIAERLYTIYAPRYGVMKEQYSARPRRLG